MKNDIRGGHNPQSTGASARINEVTENRLVCAAAIRYAKIGGEILKDVTPGNCDQSTDLAYGVDIANKDLANLTSIHFNNVYTDYIGAIGSEIWLNPKNTEAVATATIILNNLAALGFKNRGLKDGLNGQHLFEIIHTIKTAMIIETCFVEASEDVRIYKAAGADKIGLAIAEGLLARHIPEVANIPLVVNPIIDVPVNRVNNSIARLQIELNKQGAHLLVDGFFGPKTLAACPFIMIGAKGEITRWLQRRLSLSLQDADFGPNTRTAVINFQRACNLDADGKVGNNTWKALLR